VPIGRTKRIGIVVPSFEGQAAGCAPATAPVPQTGPKCCRNLGGERDLSDMAGSSSNAKAEADRPAAKFAKSKPLEFPGFY